MQEASFATLGLSADIVRVLAEQGIESPFQIQERTIPAALAGQDVLAKAPTGSGKTLAFAIPIVERTKPDGGRPSALVLVPTRELAVQVTEVLEELGAVPRARGRLRLRWRPDPGPGREGQEGARPRRHARPAPGSDGPPPRQPRRRLDPHPRRGRPDARHGLQAAGRQDPAQGLARPADDVLLRHARRRRRRAGPRLYEPARQDRGRASEQARARARSSISSSPSRPRTRSRSSSSCSARSAGSRSSSCGRSAAPTGSRSGSRSTTCGP